MYSYETLRPTPSARLGSSCTHTVISSSSHDSRHLLVQYVDPTVHNCAYFSQSRVFWLLYRAHNERTGTSKMTGLLATSELSRKGWLGSCHHHCRPVIRVFSPVIKGPGRGAAFARLTYVSPAVLLHVYSAAPACRCLGAWSTTSQSFCGQHVSTKASHTLAEMLTRSCLVFSSRPPTRA
jgi:hypothetical protein